MNRSSGTDDGAETPYEHALRRVIWGEERTEVLLALEKDGLSADEAVALHRQAVAERVAMLRARYGKRAVTGVLLVIGGMVGGVVLWHFTQGFEVWDVRRSSLTGKRYSAESYLAAAAGVMFLSGVWLFIDGLAGRLTAATRPGEVTDVDG